MAKRRYFVDWTDAVFPEIRPIEGAWDPGERTALTFKQARAEVVKDMRSKVQFYRDRVAYYSRLKEPCAGQWHRDGSLPVLPPASASHLPAPL